MSTDESNPSDTANAGCDRCGTNDRAPEAKYCQACIEASYRVYVDGAVETGYIHDTPQDAHDEAFLVAESALEGTVEVRGPNGYRKVVAVPCRRQEGTISRRLGRLRSLRPTRARGPQTARERTARELERAEWPAVAEDVRDGLSAEEILARLRAIGEGGSDAAEIVAAGGFPAAAQTAEPGGEVRTITLDRARRNAIRLAADVVEEHAGDSDDPAAMAEAVSQLEEILHTWQTAPRAA